MFWVLLFINSPDSSLDVERTLSSEKGLRGQTVGEILHGVGVCVVFDSDELSEEVYEDPSEELLSGALLFTLPDTLFLLFLTLLFSFTPVSDLFSLMSITDTAFGDSLFSSVLPFLVNQGKFKVPAIRLQWKMDLTV